MMNLRICAVNEKNLDAFRYLLPQKWAARLLTAQTDCLGVIHDGEEGAHAAGVLVYTVEEDDPALSMDWIYIAPACRGKGYGPALLNTLLAGAAKTEEVEEIRAAFPATGDFKALRDLLSGQGFQIDDAEAAVFKTTCAALQPRRGAAADKSGVLPLNEVPEMTLRIFLGQLRSTGTAIPLPRHFACADYEPGSAVLVTDGELQGLFLLRFQDGKLLVPWVFLKQNHRAATGFSRMLNTVSDYVTERFDPETPIVVETINPTSAKLMEKIFPDAHRTDWCTAHYIY